MVTGGAGFIGSALTRHLVRQTPHDVVVVDKLTYAGSLASLETVAHSNQCRFVQLDIADSDRVLQTIEETRPDIIIHLAAETHVDRSIAEADAFVRTNVVGTKVLLDAALTYWRHAPTETRRRFRFHHVSTDEVFGALGAVGRFDETSPYRPNSPYAASKAASDHLVRAWHVTYGLPIIVSNSSNNFGPYQFPEKLIPLMIRNGLQGKELPVYGRGRNVRDWIFVDDHVRALLLVAERGRIGDTYVIGGGNELTNLQTVTAVCACLDRLAPDGVIGERRRLIRFVDDRPGHDFRYAVNDSKVRRELGWQPLETFETGLEKTVRWYLDNHDWWAPLSGEIATAERGAGA